MLEDGKIVGRQFAILVILYIVGAAILVIPSILATEAKQAAWIAAILAVAIGLLVLPLPIALGRRFPNKTFVEYTEEILGKWLGKTVVVLFIFAFPFLVAALTLRNIGDFLTSQVMPETPIQAIHILFVAIVIMGVRAGIEPIARAAEIFFPWIILFFLILIIFSGPYLKVDNLLPVLEDGLKPVVRAALPFVGFPFLEPVILLMLFPYVKHVEKTRKALYTGIAVGGIVLIVITLLSILVVGAESARYMYPSYAIAKKIRIDHFLERAEAAMAIIWLITIYFRLTLVFYLSVIGLAQVLNLKEYRFISLPLGMILITLSLVVLPNASYLLELIPIWGVYAWTPGVLFPLLLLGVAVVRGK